VTVQQKFAIKTLDDVFVHQTPTVQIVITVFPTHGDGKQVKVVRHVAAIHLAR
jgi:hypothetical protein